MEDYRLEQTGQEVQRILNGAAMQVDLTAEVDRATDAEGRLQDNIDAEERARQDADGLLQQGISDEENRAKRAEEANAGEIEGIKALIPATATSDNKLADTNYVNSSIQTATAEYRGDYNVVTDLHLAIDATHAQIETLLGTVIAEADKNDYCYVMIPTNAQTPTEIAKIERYKMTSEGWKFEYDVNNSTFTAEEWAAIKSGITSGLVAKLNALPTNADLLLLLAGKQDELTFDATPVPESNNPVKSGGVYSAIDDEKTARLNSDTAIHTELDGLQAKVPATASSDNKLVDQNQMNSSISTATATYRGDWNVVSDLHLAVDATRAQIAAMLPTVISTADNNDYCYVEIPTSAETPTQIERVERYKFNGAAWAYEYVLNNSGFTAAQWAAINSMITSGLVAKLSALPTNADLLAMLAQKQDNLTFDTTPTENSTNPVTSGGVFAADKALSDAIEAILLLIPSAASALNKLVDQNLMNSSISTATATFRGTYNLISGLHLDIDATEGQIAAALLSAISTADNNDYAFVQIPTSAETPAQIARTDRYKFNGTAWGYEYTLNTSGFTAAQWAAINSTITSALVAKLNALPTAAELQEALGVLTSGITAINQKIPSTASQANKLVDNASMESYIAQVINILDASFNVTSTDGHITLHITQVDGVITSVQVQSTDIASAADLALKASQADLTAIASRVTTAEGNITSLTGRMGTAESNIANLQQLYNNLQQSKPVPVTALPSTGQQQGVIYRLAGTSSYSDYMWNGSTWVLMATYNNAIDDEPTAGSDNLVKSGGITKFLPCARFIGKNSTLIESSCYLFKKNHIFTIYLNSISWNMSSLPDSATVFSVESYDSSNTITYLVRCRKSNFSETIKPSYTITIPADSVSVKICFRGNAGEELRVDIIDVTQTNEIQDLLLLNDIVDLSLYTPVDGYVDNEDGKWHDTTSSVRKHICVPLNNSSKIVTIHANSEKKAIVDFLSEYNVVEDGDAGMVGGENTIEAGKIFSCSVPEGANYLYIQYNSYNFIYLPKAIYINSLPGQVEQNRTDISSILSSYLNTKNILIQSLNTLKDYSVLSVYKPDEYGSRIYFDKLYAPNNANFNIETNEEYNVALNLLDSNGNMIYDSGWKNVLTSDTGVLYNYQYAYFRLVFRKSNNAATNLNDVIQNAVSELNIECFSQKYEDYLDFSLFNTSKRKNTVRNIAHQGYSPTSNYGDNLAVNYINAAKTGFDYGECDITFSSDGVAFCSHGIKVDNVWQDAFMDDNNVIVYFAENTAEQIKSHPYLGTTVSTFEEVIAACKSVGLGLYIDKISRIDTDEKWNTTFSVIKRYAMCDNVVFMPKSLLQAQKVFSVYPSAKVSIITDLSTATSIANQVKTPYNDVRIDVDYSDNTVAQIKEGYAQLNPGIGIDVYTIDNSTTFKEYLPYVCGITSNKLCEKNIS